MKTKTQSLLIAAIALTLTACGNQTKTADKAATEVEAISDSKENMRSSKLGSFTYFADAAVFNDCTNNQEYQVSGNAGGHNHAEVFLQLQKEYTDAGLEMGVPIYIELEGEVTTKAKGEEGLDLILIPKQYKRIDKKKSGC